MTGRRKGGKVAAAKAKGKDITEVIAAGREKLASVPTGDAGEAAAAESKKEEKVAPKRKKPESSSETVPVLDVVAPKKKRTVKPAGQRVQSKHARLQNMTDASRCRVEEPVDNTDEAGMPGTVKQAEECSKAATPEPELLAKESETNKAEMPGLEQPEECSKAATPVPELLAKESNKAEMPGLEQPEECSKAETPAPVEVAKEITMEAGMPGFEQPEETVEAATPAPEEEAEERTVSLITPLKNRNLSATFDGTDSEEEEGPMEVDREDIPVPPFSLVPEVEMATSPARVTPVREAEVIHVPSSEEKNAGEASAHIPVGTVDEGVEDHHSDEEQEEQEDELYVLRFDPEVCSFNLFKIWRILKICDAERSSAWITFHGFDVWILMDHTVRNFFAGVPFIHALKKSTYRFLEHVVQDCELEGHDKLPVDRFVHLFEDGSKESRKRRKSKGRRVKTGEELGTIVATGTLETGGTSVGGSKGTLVDEGELSSLIARTCKEVLAQQLQEGGLVVSQPASSQPAWDADHPLMKQMCMLASQMAGMKEELAGVVRKEVAEAVEEKLNSLPAPMLSENQLQDLEGAGECIKKLKELEILTPEAVLNEVRDSTVQLSKEIAGSTCLFRDGIQGLYINHNNEMLRVAESVADLTKAVASGATLNGELLERVEALIVMMQAEGREVPSRREMRDLKGKSIEGESSQQVTQKDLDRALQVSQRLEHAQVPPPNPRARLPSQVFPVPAKALPLYKIKSKHVYEQFQAWRLKGDFCSGATEQADLEDFKAAIAASKVKFDQTREKLMATFREAVAYGKDRSSQVVDWEVWGEGRPHAAVGIEHKHWKNYILLLRYKCGVGDKIGLPYLENILGHVLEKLCRDLAPDDSLRDGLVHAKNALEQAWKLIIKDQASFSEEEAE